jgi:N-acetylneuraminic acid mutarotase
LEARTAAAAAVVGGKLVVVGGASGGNPSLGVEVLELSKLLKWTRPSLTLSAPRTAHVAVTVGTKIYVIGGATQASAAGITGLVEEITVR